MHFFFFLDKCNNAKEVIFHVQQILAEKVISLEAGGKEGEAAGFLLFKVKIL